MKDKSKIEASRRLRTAMARIESVERHLDAAAQSISVVTGPGIGAEWEKLRALVGLAKASWRRLEEKVLSECFDLDDLAKIRFLEQANLKVM